jgi:hypothetical protein
VTVPTETTAPDFETIANGPPDDVSIQVLAALLLSLDETKSISADTNARHFASRR